MSKVGVVVIGRNEGERLQRCLESAKGQSAALVYVDSGSTDGSVALRRTTASATWNGIRRWARPRPAAVTP
jgi:glycosyltransferase involved in cell wall biosynthesis